MLLSMHEPLALVLTWIFSDTLVCLVNGPMPGPGCCSILAMSVLFLTNGSVSFESESFGVQRNEVIVFDLLSEG